MTREELIADLRAKLNTVSRRMQPGLTMRAQGAQLEHEYATLYDRIAKLGGAARLRRKYRGK